jgi:hypothetical protein
MWNGMHKQNCEIRTLCVTETNMETFPGIQLQNFVTENLKMDN